MVGFRSLATALPRAACLRTIATAAIIFRGERGPRAAGLSSTFTSAFDLARSAVLACRARRESSCAVASSAIAQSDAILTLSVAFATSNIATRTPQSMASTSLSLIVSSRQNNRRIARYRLPSPSFGEGASLHGVGDRAASLNIDTIR